MPRPAKKPANGGPDRDQTDDLVVANDALYQLSYRPVKGGEVLGKAASQVNINFRSGPADETVQ
jgi:hypothetical protein